jgi:hypothetical protein
MFAVPVTWKVRQKDHEFQASLGYTVRPCLKKREDSGLKKSSLLQNEFSPVKSGLKPMRTKHKQGEMRLTCFSEIVTALEAEQLFLLSCLCSAKQEGRFLLLQCHAPPQSLCSTLFAAVYKRPTERGLEALASCLWLLLWALVWVFHLGLFGVGCFWKGKEWLKTG